MPEIFFFLFWSMSLCRIFKVCATRINKVDFLSSTLLLRISQNLQTIIFFQFRAWPFLFEQNFDNFATEKILHA